jgi:YD repeat-containing protein
VKHKLTKNYLYDSENHFQLTSNEILVNDELKVKEEFVYSSDLFFLEDIDLGGNTIQVKRYYIPKDKNRIGRPVQYLKIKNNQVVAANFNKWESIEGYYAPTKNYRLNGTIAYNDFVKPVYNDNQLQIDNRFELKEEKTLNEYFSVTESIDGHGIKYQYSWGYKESEIIAKVSNTENGFFFTSFEDVNDSWNAPQSEMSDLAKTGSKSIKPLNVLEVLEPLSAGQYYVEVYLKSTNGSTSETVTIDNINGETPINVDDEIEVDSEWTYNKIPITVDEATQLVFNSTGNILFDELRIYPVDAQMESYTYEPLVGMTSMNDANGRITYFEYDEAGRLKLKRDHEGNILEAFEYNYVNK